MPEAQAAALDFDAVLRQFASDFEKEEGCLYFRIAAAPPAGDGLRRYACLEGVRDGATVAAHAARAAPVVELVLPFLERLEVHARAEEAAACRAALPAVATFFEPLAPPAT
jgi:hypothetical protein